jgi:hypothetical protein
LAGRALLPLLLTLLSPCATPALALFPSWEVESSGEVEEVGVGIFVLNLGERARQCAALIADSPLLA